MPDRAAAILARFVTPGGDALRPHAYVFLVLLCLAFFIPGFTTLPPTDRDESSFAQATKQMVESGNYVDIRLQDKPRYKKPIGIYWLQAASVRLLDPRHLNEIWAYRIPSLLGATLAVLMTAATGSLLFGPMAGLLAAIMIAGCVILNAEARLAKTDAALLGSIMVMQYALARAYIKGSRVRWGSFFAFWTALGAGILIKGPVILLVLASTLLWLRIADKNLKWFAALRPFIGIPYALLLVAPWFIAIMAASHGAFLQQSAGQDLFAKLWQGQNRGILPPGLHLLAFPIVFFPFSLYALLAAPDAWKNRRDPAVKFCLGWIIPAWIVFELSLTKLPHYTLPLYPAIAMLAVKFLLDGFSSLSEKNGGWLWALLIGLWLVLGTGFAFAFALLPYLDNSAWNIWQIAAGAALILAQSTSLFIHFENRGGSIIALACGSLLFMACVFGSTLPDLRHVWLSREIVQMANGVKPCAQTQIVSASYGEPSLVFLAGTGTKIVADGAQAAAGMQNNRCMIGVIDDKHKQAFLDAFSGAHERPVAAGEIKGLNTGKGRPAAFTLYTLPARAGKS